MATKTKTCGSCSEAKPLEAFHRKGSGRASSCSDCVNESKRARRQSVSAKRVELAETFVGTVAEFRMEPDFNEAFRLYGPDPIAHECEWQGIVLYPGDNGPHTAYYLCPEYKRVLRETRRPVMYLHQVMFEVDGEVVSMGRHQVRLRAGAKKFAVGERVRVEVHGSRTTVTKA